MSAPWLLFTSVGKALPPEGQFLNGSSMVPGRNWLAGPWRLDASW